MDSITNDNHSISTHGKGVLIEMDFFSHHTNHKPNPPPAADTVKKEQRDNEEEDIQTGLNLLTGRTSVSDNKSLVEDGLSQNKQGYNQRKKELAILQAEINQMNTENQRLKGMLNQVNHNYRSLKMQLVALTQRNQNQKPITVPKEEVARHFLDLGKADDHTSQLIKDERSQSSAILSSPNIIESMEYDSTNNNNNRSPMMINSSYINEIDRDISEEALVHGWIPNKVPKFNNNANASRNGDNDKEEEEEKPETISTCMMRKARVSVRARSEASMISDGCQWRKYGQKMAKGNPCPRAYYRCTMASGCPVRKQVQRSAENKAILVTTYEGYHSHPLPPAAIAMASTTSAAAQMLLSGSMQSQDGLTNINSSTKTFPSYPFPGVATLSASAPFPTVTLDLTHQPQVFNPLQRSQPYFLHSFASAPLVSAQAVCDTNNPSIKFSGLLRPQEMELSQQQHVPEFLDTISDITADPNFTAALVAAISSIVNGGNVHQTNNSANNGCTINNSVDKFSLNK
ncbi:hypothetical protein JCGZ_00917 [Jatropha curcas]|uniref:WRKY domain-containing protein n=1 Tax=Jatropha curcas TaxID=180498 RepID=A0A067L3T4_JATCU|nr:hypothetical protein JCGZ_00917 [Jatropha curcas]